MKLDMEAGTMKMMGFPISFRGPFSGSILVVAKV